MTKLYVEHKGKVIETNGQFKHVMAITLNPLANYREGVARCITSRSGNLAFKGNLDRSELYKIGGDSLEHFKIEGRLNIKNEEEIIDSLTPPGWDFIGLEDPDIWIDPDTGLMHLYFTIPIKPPDKMHDEDEKIKVHLVLETIQLLMKEYEQEYNAREIHEESKCNLK